MFKPFLRFALVGGAASLIAGAASAAPTAAPAQVTIGNFTFGPAVLTVSPGTTVTWLNGDDIPHTVVAADKTTFRSKVLDSGDRFSFTFVKAGAYTYFCSIHPHMVGKIVVRGR